MTRKLLATAALAAAAITMAACADSTPPDPQDAEPPALDEQAPAPDMPEPDVQDVPDVVATVNDDEITAEHFTTLYQMQFEQMVMEAQMAGAEPDQDEMKDQTLQAMIDSQLLVQDAQDRGHEASAEDVDTLLEETATANQIGSVQELLDVYAEQGVSEELVRDDARTQLLVEALIENDLDVAEPTDQEVTELYDSLDQDAQGEESMDLEEIRPELENQLRNQNRGEAVQAHLGQLRDDAEVHTHL